MNMML